MQPTRQRALAWKTASRLGPNVRASRAGLSLKLKARLKQQRKIDSLPARAADVVAILAAERGQGRSVATV
jgi:hypothetical protein